MNLLSAASRGLHPRRGRLVGVAVLCVTACLVALTVGAGADAAPRVSVLAKNLNSPRGLNFAPEGHLIVVESGNGAAPCAGGSTFTILPRNAPSCVNTSGVIVVRSPGSTSFDRYHQGWPSWRTNVPGQPAEVTGLHDIDFPGPAKAFVTIGWGGTPSARTGPAASKSFGRVVRTGPGRAKIALADIAGYEQRFNPAGGPVDSNPYGVLAEARSVFVADAGANAVFEVKPSGAISVVATFPATTNPAGCTLPGATPQPGPPVSESVPTTVVRGPDKALYVGELTGFPFCAGSARIWRIAPGGRPTVWQSGLKMIIDMDFARDGSLYVLQFASSPSLPGGPGQIVRIRRNGSRQVLDLGERLQQPGGIAVGPKDSALYVTNSIAAPGTGEVLRIVP